MPAFLLMLLAGLASAAGSITGRVLIALGVSYVAYSGLDVMLGAVETQVDAALNGVPLLARQVLSAVQLDTVLKVLLSAYSARLALMGLTSGVVTRMVLK